ncbi:MAG: sigma-70 family RNA polymerase sigma factor, partial [Bacteroidota bacterium]
MNFLAYFGTMPSDPYLIISDQELIDLYRNQQATAALGELMRRYRTQVFGRCLQLLGDRESAQDCCQTTFEHFIGLLNTKQDVTFVPGLLYQIASRRAIDLLRRRRIHNNAIKEITTETKKSLSFFVENPDFVRLSIEQSEKEALVKKAMNSLPPFQRDCLH